MKDFSHLDAIAARLDRNQQRANIAKTPSSKRFFEQQVRQDEKELTSEYKFLGIVPATVEDLTDDELLAELNAK